MPNWCTNTILIIGPSEDVSVLFKSLEEYDNKKVEILKNIESVGD